MYWAVRAEEYVSEVGERAFIGLPREEIERLHGLLEVHAVEHAAGCLTLATFTAIHYNYAWFTYAGEQRTLGIQAAIEAQGEPPLFLDHAFEQFARREVARAVVLDEAWQWRMAGLINDGQQLGLVYIARLRQRALEPRSLEPARMRFFGNGELRFARHDFEPWSQLLIDNLDAF